MGTSKRASEDEVLGNIKCYEPFSLSGRVALVTGGNRGIGRAISRGLADAGAEVVIAGRSLTACEEVVKEIVQAGGKAVAAPTDMGVQADRAHLIELIRERFGFLDILVNNAAVLRPHVTLKITEEELDELISVNLKGPVFLSRDAVPLLEVRGNASIVNVSALGAFQPMAGIGGYSAVKAALVNWTATMAMEWASRGIRVNCLVPGPVATDMILPKDPVARDGFISEIGGKSLLGRIAQPAELVGAVIFLASGASSLMTGRSLFVDGGMLP